MVSRYYNTGTRARAVLTFNFSRKFVFVVENRIRRRPEMMAYFISNYKNIPACKGYSIIYSVFVGKIDR